MNHLVFFTTLLQKGGHTHFEIIVEDEPLCFLSPFWEAGIIIEWTNALFISEWGVTSFSNDTF